MSEQSELQIIENAATVALQSGKLRRVVRDDHVGGYTQIEMTDNRQWLVARFETSTGRAFEPGMDAIRENLNALFDISV